MPRSTGRRDDRLEVRLTPGAKSLLKRPADLEDKSVSAKQYDAFAAALDTPAKARPRLEKLLTTRSVVE